MADMHSSSPSPKASDERRFLSPPPMLRPGTLVGGGGNKERRQPSITPRKFRRFFAPRNRVSASPSAARRALRDLTALALNNSQPTSSPALAHPICSLPTVLDDHSSAMNGLLSPHSAKRRKTRHHHRMPETPESSPLRSHMSAQTAPRMAATPNQAAKTLPHSLLLSPLASSPLDIDGSDGSDGSDTEMPLFQSPPERIVPLTQRGLSGHLLQRQLGVMPRPGHQTMPCPVADWRIETADFCSTPYDSHLCASQEADGSRCIAFCTASCTSNGLVAVGDEEGRIRILDSAVTGPDGFSQIHHSFAAHGNAVIDVAFSEDDSLLATASGDQTGKVFDMMTQTPISVLEHHTASLKQVRFQPGKGEGNVLATSGRDGCVKIWDLRCKGGPAQEFNVERSTQFRFDLPQRVTQGCVVNSIYDAHARTLRQARQSQIVQTSAGADVAARWEVSGRIGEVSVTAIQFLPAGKEHLILSACEADASIKLWDIRNIHTSRHKTSTPVSVTAPPESHSQWRPFGMSSMSLSTDGARLYALCKDNTVYAYSTAHLILGVAPELSSKGDPPRRRNGTAQEGLGPMYGFRHENLHATSFYVKTAIRPAQDGRSELLAVGSSDGSAILFPTDERYFTDAITHTLKGSDVRASEREGISTPTFARFPSPARSFQQPQPSHQPNQEQQQHQQHFRRTPAVGGPGVGHRRPGLFRTNSISSQYNRFVDKIPIVRNGTALVRGHDMKEVGAVCWTNRGSLVTVGDDYMIRCWREDRDRAADLRTGGETEGRRWGCGWADVGDDWDKNEWDEWGEL